MQIACSQRPTSSNTFKPCRARHLSALRHASDTTVLLQGWRESNTEASHLRARWPGRMPERWRIHRWRRTRPEPLPRPGMPGRPGSSPARRPVQLLRPGTDPRSPTAPLPPHRQMTGLLRHCCSWQRPLPGPRPSTPVEKFLKSEKPQHSDTRGGVGMLHVSL